MTDQPAADDEVGVVVADLTPDETSEERAERRRQEIADESWWRERDGPPE